ncbi:MAG: hypothetical protein E7069_12695 [Bacteroidales bacterium]|jgi:hypothetical protein|nr:hypothetical protein [Bacteroidales bacterium]
MALFRGIITIEYANKQHFVHGGKGTFQNYNTDQKAAISKLKERGIDNETVYLFFVKECNALKANDSPDVVNGYMPRGYQFGFIYNELNNYRTDAHEICHGAFHLKHTFAQDDFLAAERTTDNLMDYNDGKTLNHWQWKDIHQPKSVRFRWLQDEEGAEAWSEGTRYKCISTELATKIKSKYRYFYYPDGSIVDMKDYLPSGFYLSNDVDAKTSYGTVATIREGDRDLYYSYSKQSHANRGYGYLLDGSARLKYELPSISADKASELHPVRIRLTDGKVTIIDFMGNELEAYDEQMCNCQMAKYTFSSEFEPLVVDENKEYWFYDKKENKIIIVTKVHDLSWLKIAKDSVSYDEIREFEPGEIRMTEAQLADSKYNWLRNDVIKTMNDGGKVVMVGMAVTALAPYLIEYAAAYGIETGTAILRNGVKKLGSDFATGSISEAVSYLIAEYVDKKILSEPAQPIEIKADFVSDVISAGFRNMVKPSEKIRIISVCIDGVNIDDLLNSDEDAIIRIIRGSIQCAISTGSDKLFDVIKSRISHKLINVTSQRIVMAIRKLNHNNPEAELEMVSFLCGKNNHWLSEMKRIIREYGNGAFYMLQDLDIDYMKLSTSNFERLSRFVKTNVGNENELNIMKSLLNSGRDINRMLRYIHSKGSSAKILDEICNNELFLSKIEIGGKKISARQFLLDYNGDIAMYYKRDGNYEKYIVYAIDDMKQYVELSIDNTSNTVTKIFVGYITREFDNLVSGYKNIE